MKSSTEAFEAKNVEVCFHCIEKENNPLAAEDKLKIALNALEILLGMNLPDWAGHIVKTALDRIDEHPYDKLD
jgi:hypothetical protein